MELQQYLHVLKRYWRSIVAVTLLCVAGAAALTLLMPAKYTAQSSLFVSVDSGSSGGDLYSGATYAEQQVNSLSKLATSELVLQPVIKQLKLHTSTAALASTLAVTAPTSTSIINISATDHDASQAASIANAVAKSLVSVVGTLSPTAASGSQLVRATVVNSATVPATPTSPKPMTNLALGLVLGLVVGAGQALVRSAVDARIRNPDDLAQVVDAPLLAAVGHVDGKQNNRGYGTGDPAAEAYRRLRTNVGFLTPGEDRRPSLVVTSPNEGEGKTQTVIGLARMLAQAGERVLLVDADMRRPTLAQRLALDPEPGLSQVLSGRGRFEDFVLQVDDTSLFVLPAGSIPPNPAELLASRNMENLLASAESLYDYVLIDSPPVLPVTDAVVLGERVRTLILVVRAARTKLQEVREAGRLLETAGVAVSGVVMNDVPRSGAYGYGGFAASPYYSNSDASSRGAKQRGRSRNRRPQPSPARSEAHEESFARLP